MRRLAICPSNSVVDRITTEQSAGPSVQMECVTLDDVFRTHQLARCDLLKLDCEGSEFEILEQASDDVLKRVEQIVGEFHDVDESGQSGTRLSQLLEYRGFRVERLECTNGGGVFHAQRLNRHR